MIELEESQSEAMMNDWRKMKSKKIHCRRCVLFYDCICREESGPALGLPNIIGPTRRNGNFLYPTDFMASLGIEKMKITITNKQGNNDE